MVCLSRSTLVNGTERVVACDTTPLMATIHGNVYDGIMASERGIWVKFSFVALCVTALIQVYVVGISGSIALLGGHSPQLPLPGILN
jgi:hypothetical protein